MSETTFRLRLVTPAESLLDEPVEYVNLPMWDGLMGFMRNRAPLVGRLGLGEMTVRFSSATGGAERRYLIDGGFAQMADNELIVLAEFAIPAEAIAESDAQAEVNEADAMKPDTSAEDPGAEADRIRGVRDRARLKLRLAREHRGAGRGI
tara:strand:+ start:194 stop:643 length:450 start_codon:yes stop_codon:yes gene_type:complete